MLGKTIMKQLALLNQARYVGNKRFISKTYSILSLFYAILRESLFFRSIEILNPRLVRLVVCCCWNKWLISLPRNINGNDIFNWLIRWSTCSYKTKVRSLISPNHWCEIAILWNNDGRCVWLAFTTPASIIHMFSECVLTIYRKRLEINITNAFAKWTLFILNNIYVTCRVRRSFPGTVIGILPVGTNHKCAYSARTGRRTLKPVHMATFYSRINITAVSNFISLFGISSVPGYFWTVVRILCFNEV